MKSIAMTAAAVVLFALPSLAQNDDTLPDGPKPAIRTSKDAVPADPVPGKTSFTSDQAKARMIKRGYDITSNPLKDDRGIWYAEGNLDGKPPVMVMMDYQGNIYEGTEYSGHPSSAPGVEPVETPKVKPVSPLQR